jgi:putative ABC transport system permease protein
MACCLVIFQYVSFEYSFDRFHEQERDIYRVLQTTPLTGEAFDGGGPFTGFALAPALAVDVPEILHVARLHPAYGSAIVTSPERPDRVFEEDRVFYADPAFLEMFTFPLVAGDASSGLEPGTVLISESAAQKYFAADNPMGKVLDVRGSIDRTYRVTGVFRDTPANSHLQFDFLLPMDDLIREGYADEPEGGWSWNNFFTYVQLRPDADPAEAEVKMTDVYKARRGDALRAQGRTARVFTQPLRDVHLNADFFSPEMFVTSSYRTVYFFTVIGLVTLLIALVNYVNLATARALDRAREVGVRKVVGAQRRQLVLQFLSEAALTNLIAAVLAVLLAVLGEPVVLGGFSRDLRRLHTPCGPVSSIRALLLQAYCGAEGEGGLFQRTALVAAGTCSTPVRRVRRAHCRNGHRSRPTRLHASDGSGDGSRAGPRSGWSSSAVGGD